MSRDSQDTQLISRILLSVCLICLAIVSLALNPWLLAQVWHYQQQPIAPRPFAVLLLAHVLGFTLAVIIWRARRWLLQRPQIARNPALVQRLLFVAMGLGMASVLLVLFEFTFAALNLWNSARTNPVVLERPDWLLLPDKELHHLLKPNSTANERLTRRDDGAVIYDAAYNTGPDGWRVVPGGEAAPGRSRHLVFLGCSFTFGVGVNDEDTFPSQVARQTAEHHVVNLGVTAWGTAQILRLLETRDLRPVIAEEDGIAVYLFMEDHLRRALCTMRRYEGFAPDYPYYQLDPQDQPVFRGTFSAGRSATNRLYTWAAREQFIWWSGMDIPPRYSAADYHFVARLTAAIRDQYLRQFPNGRFVTAIYPGIKSLMDYPAFEKELVQQNIEVINFPEARDFCREQRCNFESDGHPTPAFNAALAGWLVGRLGIVDGPA